MPNRLLPTQLDNEYRGHVLALWIFGLIVAVRLAQSVIVLAGGGAIAQSADGIPLDTYPAAAAQTVVALFTLSALSRLFLFALGVLALLRYRTAVPLLFLVFLLNALGSLALLQLVPIARVGAPPGPLVNVLLMGLTVLGLALSLWNRAGSRGRRSGRNAA